MGLNRIRKKKKIVNKCQFHLPYVSGLCVHVSMFVYFNDNSLELTQLVTQFLYVQVTFQFSSFIFVLLVICMCCYTDCYNTKHLHEFEFLFRRISLCVVYVTCL